MISVARGLKPSNTGQHILLAFFVVLLALSQVSCESGSESVYLEGSTMGTQYHVTLVEPPSELDQEELQQQIDVMLESLNQSMSTYREESEITRISAAPSGEWLSISEDFLQVLDEALRVSSNTAGAYDVTVGPLVDLWGFGPQRSDVVPPEGQVASRRQRVGYQALEVDRENMRLRKNEPRELDFSSLAKGYGVDRLAALLEQRKVTNYLVEIGGEIRVAGHSPRKTDWALAIERPQLLGGEPVAALALNAGAVATSGDYRNYFEVDGIRYSHTIDPRTGYPVEHQLVSVSVIADTAMRADAWATALTVLGTESAMRVAQEQSLAVFLISRKDEALEFHKTTAFDAYLQ
jgi:FAD:protein FMN transferase